MLAFFLTVVSQALSQSLKPPVSMGQMFSRSTLKMRFVERQLNGTAEAMSVIDYTDEVPWSYVDSRHVFFVHYR
jgi:hypothetical protein